MLCLISVCDCHSPQNRRSLKKWRRDGIARYTHFLLGGLWEPELQANIVHLFLQWVQEHIQDALKDSHVQASPQNRVVYEKVNIKQKWLFFFIIVWKNRNALWGSRISPVLTLTVPHNEHFCSGLQFLSSLAQWGRSQRSNGRDVRN